jgi:DNA-binding XRE family transcriptional regulator
MLTQPTPDKIRSTRLSLGLTQADCAGLIGAHTRTWQTYEAEDGKHRSTCVKMPLNKWELFLLKTSLIKIG